MSQDPEQPSQDNGQRRMTMDEIVRTLLDDRTIRRAVYDRLVEKKTGNPKFKEIVADHVASMKVNVVELKIPEDYLKVHIYSDGELAQIAVMEGFLIYVVEEEADDFIIKTFYVIDSMEKVAYYNVSKKMK